MGKVGNDKILSPQDAVEYIQTPPSVLRIIDYIERYLDKNVCIGVNLLAEKTNQRPQTVKESIRHKRLKNYQWQPLYHTCIFGTPKALAEFKKRWNESR